jgi:signal transduction histidine kinase
MGFAVITVADNGEGITPEILGTVFSRFDLRHPAQRRRQAARAWGSPSPGAPRKNTAAR